MNKYKFKVIKGNKTQATEKKYTFIEAHASNTRLMGVIGLYILWETAEGESFHQFFHLDAEEYGFDDYIGITSAAPEEVEATTAKMMGGLGGRLVPITEREARYLIREFVSKNKQYKEPMPEPEWEYIFLLREDIVFTPEEKNALWNKISEKIVSPYQLINYFIMRAVGMDENGMDYLACTPILDYQLVRKPATLLKNVIETIEENGETSYMIESVIDTDSHYKMAVSEIKITQGEKGWCVKSAELKSSMNISSAEAAFALAKKEYLAIYQIHDIWEMIRLMDQEKKHAMKHAHEAGYLFTEFNPTNEHVNRPIYYLNEDIYGVYYLTAAEQLVVAAYSQEQMEEIIQYFKEPPFEGIVELVERIDLNNLLLYEFVHSDYDNFYDFLEDQ